MLDLNIASAIVSISKLQAIDATSMKTVVEKINKDPTFIPYYLLCEHPAKNTEQTDFLTAKQYALNIIGVVEEAVNLVYSEQDKDALSDLFALTRNRGVNSIDAYRNDTLNLVDKYKNTEIGSIAWLVLENLRRELLGIYFYMPNCVDKMEELIAECRQNEEIYESMMNSI